MAWWSGCRGWTQDQLRSARTMQAVADVPMWFAALEERVRDLGQVLAQVGAPRRESRGLREGPSIALQMPFQIAYHCRCCLGATHCGLRPFAAVIGERPTQRDALSAEGCAANRIAVGTRPSNGSFEHRCRQACTKIGPTSVNSLLRRHVNPDVPHGRFMVRESPHTRRTRQRSMRVPKVRDGSRITFGGAFGRNHTAWVGLCGCVHGWRGLVIRHSVLRGVAMSSLHRLRVGV